MEEFIAPRGEELEKRFQQLSTEFLLLGKKVSVEFLKSKYNLTFFPDNESPEATTKRHNDPNRHSLYLGGMKIDIIPINSLIQFDPTVLDLSSNDLIEIPSKISGLKSIKELYLSGNRFTSAPGSISKLLKLQKLTLSRGNLTELTQSICRLSQLRVLHLDSNKFSKLPKCLATLNLIELKIQFNDFKKLPEWIFEIKSLEIIDIRKIGLIELPDFLQHLPNLKEIHIGENEIDFPDKIGQLDKYEWIFSNERGGFIGNDGYLVLYEDLLGDEHYLLDQVDRVVRYYHPSSVKKHFTYDYYPELRITDRTYPQL